MSFYEFINTIPTLWNTVQGTRALWIDAFTLTTIEFLDANPELMPPDNAMSFISDDNGATYNQCHCACFLRTLS